ncbi:MAG: fibronectin type III domain-containing protein [Acholeplasmataceae bacterium]|nr:fibronectin type III domain-containing protein [Acholeplasmataceae bacterium]
MELFNEPIIQQKVLSDVIKNDNVITNSTMVGGSFNGGKITIGSGENIFTANKDGIFLGSSSFSTAPFRVDMAGNMTASSAIISGDIESSNYTDIAPYTGYKLEYLTGKLYANDVVIRGGTIGGQAVVNVGYASDSTALAVPTGLTISTTGTTTAEDGTISSYLTITWATITGNTFREYKVRYKKSAFTYYQYISTTSNTLTIEGLTPNTSYDFSVASVNKYGIESSYSATVSGTTATNGVAPITVIAGSATAGIQYIILEWSANSERDISSYNIYRNTTNNSGTASLIANVKTNYFVDGGRTGGTEYFYWIKAVNTSGLESASFSTVKSATPRNVTSDDVVTLAGSKVLIDGTTYLSNWRNSTDLTKIDGGNIYTGTVTTTQLNFTPVQNTNVIASINASTEGITIDADNLTISSATTFTSGYDPTDKVAELGGTYDSASSGAMVRIFPDSNTGIQVIDDATNDVFKCLVGGTDVGDVLIGDYSHDKGMFYDKSASTFTFKGLMNAGSIDGVTITGGTIQTSSTGQRVAIASSDNTITFYNSSGNSVTQLGGGDYIGTALRVNLDSSTTTGVFVNSSQESDIGFQYASSSNYTSVGTNIQLTGATNTGIGVNINHDGSGGEGIFVDVSAGADGVEILNNGSGNSLKINSTAGQSININHSATNYNAIELTASGSYDALLINSNLGNGKSAIHTNTSTGGCAFFESSAGDPAVTITHSANTGTPALTINKTGIGNGIYLYKNSRGSTISIDQDDSTNNDSVGLELDIYNGVYPTRALAFNFVGNIRANASSLGSLSGVIRVKHGGSVGYIPVYSSYS